MNKKIFALAVSACLAFGAFAQNDLQPLAVVKLNKSETITLKSLKARVGFTEKQYAAYGVQSLTVEQRAQVLEDLIAEKLISQAASKEGLSVTDSQVNSAFLNTFSQQLGQQVTESQLNDFIQNSMHMSLDEYLKQSTGMTVAEYKAYLKTQIVGQQYVFAKKQDDIQKVSATDSEIRQAYDMNKAQFVRNDMLKLFLVMYPKGTSEVDARAACTDMRNQYVKSAKVADSFKKSTENGTKYRAGELTVAKTTQQAQQLGWSYDKIIELFGKNVGFVSEITETETDFQFYAVLNKYDAKMLELSDVVQPDVPTTVYEYIKANLTAQKQNQYFAMAVQELVKELDTPANVDRKKTGDELNKLLNW